MEAIALGLGLLLIVAVVWDLFETIVVPRPTPGWFRLGKYMVRGSWRAAIKASGHTRSNALPKGEAKYIFIERMVRKQTRNSARIV